MKNKPLKKNLLIFTNSAARKVKDLIFEEKNQALKLRLYIVGGGCSGFQYAFSFDENQRKDDILIENKNTYLLIDPISFQYLVGAEVDYKEDINGSNFIIRNPNAKTTCGCGSSFSI